MGDAQDVWDDEEDVSSHLLSKGATQILSQQGYRLGAATGEETFLQEGFDIGFREGLNLGKGLGRILAMVVMMNTECSERVRSIIMDRKPSRESLEEIVALLSSSINENNKENIEEICVILSNIIA